MTERRFAKALRIKGEAAHIRENVSAALRESAIQNRPKLVDPIDYETFVVKNKVVLTNDPQRDMLNFPFDDIQIPQPTPTKTLHTACSTVPKNAASESSSLMVRQCIKTYTGRCHMINFKYHAYAGSYQQLPSAKKLASLPEHVFEIDAEDEEKDDDTLGRSQTSTTEKKGWLFKGPDSGKDNPIFTKQFKRRYFVLKQQTDFTFILAFYKDEKRYELKGEIYLDLAVEVVRNPKKGKFSFEIRMQDRPPSLLAAENEADMDDWIRLLNKVINAAETASQVSRESIKDETTSSGKPENYKESSINHPVVKYSRETDGSLAKARQENRQNMFSIYPDMRRFFDEDEEEEVIESEIDLFPAAVSERFSLRLEEFRLKLQVNLADEGQGHKICNPEPFFISFALYDAKEGRKISEDFHIDPNEPEISAMIPHDILQASDHLHTVEGRSNSPDLYGLSEDWLKSVKRHGVFSVIQRHSEIYLVAKIEKVLQGSVSQCVEPYIRVADGKVASKVHRQMKQFCGHIGHYRMPFAWSARNLTLLSGNCDLPIYKQESIKMTQDEIIRMLLDIRKPEKLKLQVIPGIFKIRFQMLEPNTNVPNMVSASLVPILPFPVPPKVMPTFEVEEFPPERASLCSTFSFYRNNLYIYPLQLKYDAQKSFTKARNIACCIEVRDTDDVSSVPMKCIYGRRGSSVFTTVATTAVVHHVSTPTYTEEVKVLLPTHIHDKHHLLFRFYHVSCEGSRTANRSSAGSSVKKKDSIELVIGFAWMPLLVDGRVAVGDRMISVSSNLPPGYLNHETPPLGRGNTGPDIKWVDGGKQLFKINLRLMSTIYTQDQHLHNFFQVCQKIENSHGVPADLNSINKLKTDIGIDTSETIQRLLSMTKSLLAVETSTYIQFLPTLLDQLFHLLTTTNSEDVGTNTVRVIIYIVSSVHDASKLELLQKYVKYIFRPDPIQKGAKQKTVHEELAKYLTSILRPANADPEVIKRFLAHAWFMLEILVKSMTQFLIDTDRVKMPRNERFSSDCQYRMNSLLQTVIPHIVQKHTEKCSKDANHSIAHFVKQCFTLMDRGFVFRLIAMYIDNFNIPDEKILHNFKFEFLRIVCSHEHYIPLCLPLMRKGLKTFKDIKPEDLRQDFMLSDEFRHKHYLVGLLLFELKNSLKEPRDMRRSAITVLRNQLAKHSFDDRYKTKSQQGRIAALYLPLIGILLENKLRLSKDSHSPQHPPKPETVANGDAKSQRSNSLVPRTAPASDTRPTSNVLEMIAGGVAISSNLNISLVGSQLLNGSTTSIDSATLVDEKEAEARGHKRSDSTTTLTADQPAPVTRYRYDKLDITEIKDLLLSFLYLLRHLPEDILLGWFNNSSEHDIIDFFSLLGLCLHHFRYQGRKRIFTLSMIGDTKKALSMPSSRKPQVPSWSSNRTPSIYSESGGDGFHTPTGSDADAMVRALQEANMSTEVGLTVLDILTQFCQTFKKELESRDGDNALMKNVFKLYLSFLKTSQSESLQKHVFGAWRAFIKKFQTVLFKGSATMCGELCYEILRCCSSKLNSTRREACALLYLLMRTNFEFSNKRSFTRVHLQVIISVSKLIGDVVMASTSRFQESLAIVNNYANSDKGIQNALTKKTPFPGEVKDLTKRIRTVLMATAQMKENEGDPELLIDLQYSLAKSYASTPELRRTWLHSMARLHTRHGNYSEAAHCYIHIAALIAEYLKRRGKIKSRSYPQGCSSFSRISPNIAHEESGIKDDSGMQDVQYTEDTLVEVLEEAARFLEKAERYEVLGEVYKIVIPIYEKKRDFKKLESCYSCLSESYKKVQEVMISGKRFLGSYFRVAFFGQTYFDDLDGQEYIYKEPNVTNLTEICERLHMVFTDKYGKDTVKLIKDSAKVNPSELDPKFAHIQITHVIPYFDDKDNLERLTDFERNNNIRCFMYETPFTKDGKTRGDISQQCKRRTILNSK
ncbi:LOW QUALITY PROTEIN: dedicator of cytokinesis protein 9-like [Gigantopelta aegis]|uniref:LOW QUALITY PROTEIN: dedicator of cytokinesis protein 9-like n=1 Tax=Gigantopelta aegis TaxID=1735272 RepID=UPI001B88AB42|nr:LOW QUALITY PROTEIN: dedicator of cytokinesis protein 9-like [Gigantopelta aegis]